MLNTAVISGILSLNDQIELGNELHEMVPLASVIKCTHIYRIFSILNPSKIHECVRYLCSESLIFIFLVKCLSLFCTATEIISKRQRNGWEVGRVEM